VHGLSFNQWTMYMSRSFIIYRLTINLQGDQLLLIHSDVYGSKVKFQIPSQSVNMFYHHKPLKDVLICCWVVSVFWLNVSLLQELHIINRWA